MFTKKRTVYFGMTSYEQVDGKPIQKIARFLQHFQFYDSCETPTRYQSSISIINVNHGLLMLILKRVQ